MFKLDGMKTDTTFVILKAKHQKRVGKSLVNERLIRQKLYQLRSSIKWIRLPKSRRVLVNQRSKMYASTETMLWGMVSVVEAVLDIACFYGFEIGDEIARHFPDMCGYCREPTCICHTLLDKPSERIILPSSPDWATQKSVTDFQSMLWRIYPKPQTNEGLYRLVLHLGEEILELLEVLDNDVLDRDQLVLEATDVVEKPFDIASLIGVPLAPFLMKHYGLR